MSPAKKESLHAYRAVEYRNESRPDVKTDVGSFAQVRGQIPMQK